jgi:hypothetical protein
MNRAFVSAIDGTGRVVALWCWCIAAAFQKGESITLSPLLARSFADETADEIIYHRLAAKAKSEAINGDGQTVGTLGLAHR